MIVRTAARPDLLGVGRVAEAAHWASYEGLLRPETIGQIVTRDFSPSALGRRLLRGGMMVATLDDEIVGFGDGVPETDRLHVEALATLPELRRHGIATAVLAGLRQKAQDLPAAADVLLGHLEVEQFFETSGFVPGEVRQRELFGVEVIERRWWAEAAAEAGRTGMTASLG